MAMSDADKKDQADMTAKLKGMKKGADFDRMFLDMMSSAHDREITKIDADIAVVTDPDLKAALEKTKPVLQSHSDAAKALQKTVTSSMEMK
jgi:predicted outer membrane protein